MSPDLARLMRMLVSAILAGLPGGTALPLPPPLPLAGSALDPRVPMPSRIVLPGEGTTAHG